MGHIDTMSSRWWTDPDACHAGVRTIVETAVSTEQFSTLAAAVRAADLVETLASPGPFTVFAPTDRAFAKLPPGEVSRLLQPENRRALTSMVTSHVLAGCLTVEALRERVEAKGGELRLRTVDNGEIRITADGDRVKIHRCDGDGAEVTLPDVLQANGVIHVMDTVLLPRDR